VTRTDKDEAREYRIAMEIVVDAYGEEECALGWYYHLESQLHFPFKARCVTKRGISPFKVGEMVRVVGMLPEDDCMHEMFVEATWSDRTLGVPLSQLEPVDADDETREAIEDWHYWVSMGYRF